METDNRQVARSEIRIDIRYSSLHERIAKVPCAWTSKKQDKRTNNGNQMSWRRECNGGCYEHPVQRAR